ncbi:universal stress protein [Nocardia asteroides]|uniref:universal stress protein n=1 Tax=Nocardia asteroides TaxID=1824 RepID=UPI0033DA0045
MSTWSPCWRGHGPRDETPGTRQHREPRPTSASLAGYAGTYPQVRIHQIVADGDPAERILDESAGAQLIDVGSRGRGGFALGSVCRAVLDEATVPVLVARPRPGGRRHSRSSERQVSQDRRLELSHETKGPHPWSRYFWSTITKSSGTA